VTAAARKGEGDDIMSATTLATFDCSQRVLGGVRYVLDGNYYRVVNQFERSVQAGRTAAVLGLASTAIRDGVACVHPFESLPRASRRSFERREPGDPPTI